MNKSELLTWLHERNDSWESLVTEVGSDRMNQPGANADWSFKELVNHLNGWQVRFNARFRAAANGEPIPPPPWPAELEEDDDINAWIYETGRDRSADEVLENARRMFREVLEIIEAQPDDARIDTLEERFHLIWVGDKRFHVSEFFDHFRDDHEENVRAWLAGEVRMDPMDKTAQTPWPKKIGALTLFVEDLDAAKDFYQAVFDLPIFFEGDTSAVFNFGNTLINLLVTSNVPELINPAPMAAPEAGHRAVYTVDVEDVDAVCERLADLGVELLNGPMDRPWGIRSASFIDPGGHIWEVAAPLG